jgi:hypothetical protein
MGEIIRHKVRGRLINVGYGSVLFFFAIIAVPIFLLKRWSDDIWEQRAMATMFRPLPNLNQIENATVWDRIARTQEMLNCSPSAVFSQSRLKVLSKPNYHQEPSSCPFYFKWIRQDMKPWAKTGITLDMVEAAKKSAYFRLTIVNHRMYVESYQKSYQTRDLFTIWGIAQLLKYYPRMLPDLDLMFNCDDRPTFQRADYSDPAKAPPPLFRYCGSEDSFDIAFPDWSFWGWPEIGTPTWETLVKEIVNVSREVKWEDRDPTAYWKGNPTVANVRRDLMKCKNKRNWNGRLYVQDWITEMRKGFPNSKLSEQCHHRFKIYIEGNAWSVSLKNILACDSPTLLITPQFYEFFLRGLFPQYHYWPVRADKKCDSIQLAVNWGNNHKNKAKEIGEAAREFILNELKMSNVYDYMFHVLNEYSKLFKYKPSVPKNAVECWPDTIVCYAETEAQKECMKDSIITTANPSPPCELGDEEQDEIDIDEFLERKAESMNHVQQLEEKMAKGLYSS